MHSKWWRPLLSNRDPLYAGTCDPSVGKHKYKAIFPMYTFLKMAEGWVGAVVTTSCRPEWLQEICHQYTTEPCKMSLSSVVMWSFSKALDPLRSSLVCLGARCSMECRQQRTHRGCTFQQVITRWTQPSGASCRVSSSSSLTWNYANSFWNEEQECGVASPTQLGGFQAGDAVVPMLSLLLWNLFL